MLTFEPLESRDLLAVITVTTNIDEFDGSIADGDVSLRDALDAANEQDTIDFDASLSGEEIRLTLGDLQITTSLTIDGSALDEPVTIRRRATLFTVDDGNTRTDSNVILRGLHVQGDLSISTKEDLEIVNATISGAQQCAIDAAGTDDDKVRVTIRNSDLVGNLCGLNAVDSVVYIDSSSVIRNGTGIRVFDSNLHLESSSVTQNLENGVDARDGSIVDITSSSISSNGKSGLDLAQSTLTATQSTISNNQGRGIDASLRHMSASIEVESSTISDNGGHGLYARSNGGDESRLGSTLVVTVSSSTISNNKGTGIHAQAFHANLHVRVSDSNITGNTTVGNGGGIHALSEGSYFSLAIENDVPVAGYLSITSSTISGNSATEDGGGVFHQTYCEKVPWRIRDIPLEIRSSVITGNSAGRDGGGVHGLGTPHPYYSSCERGNAAVHGSTVHNNNAGRNGGGILGAGELVNSTISSNSATGTGGGVHQAPRLQAVSSTITQNESSTVGGVSDAPGATFRNTILAGNVGMDLDDSENVTLESSLTDTDPMLTPLGNFGGPTPTHVLLPSSPAIDAGTLSEDEEPLEFDQRGEPFHRVVGTSIDIGAVEYRESNATIDFDGDGQVGCHDADALVQAIAVPNPSSIFDQNGDGLVNEFDLDLWLVRAGRERSSQQAFVRGDVNLDGVVDAIDLNQIGKHWQHSDVGWCGGDVNADSKVDELDLNLLAKNWLDGKQADVAEPAIHGDRSFPTGPNQRRFAFGLPRRQR